MPAATTKAELLAVTKKEFDKLQLLIDKVDDQVAVSVDGEGIAIKDIVAHRAHWIGLFLGWYSDGLAGKAVYFPAEGYKWNDLKRYNSDLRASQKTMGWPQACDALNDANQQLIDFIDASTNDELYGAPMVGANNSWTPGRWAEAAGPSHFRSAAKYIRARNKKI